MVRRVAPGNRCWCYITKDRSSPSEMYQYASAKGAYGCTLRLPHPF